MLSQKERIKLAKELGYSREEIVLFEEMDPYKAEIYLDFEKDTRNEALERMFHQGFSTEKIMEVKETEIYDGVITKNELKRCSAKFRGYLAAKTNITDNSLGLLLNFHYENMAKKISCGDYSPIDDSLNEFIEGFSLGHHKKMRESSIFRCGTVLRAAVSDENAYEKYLESSSIIKEKWKLKSLGDIN
jgi:hypothetical protein|tara:strand:+ start:20 stop:583 length:564 start_codon:yes stop_codon:yes gene_type:complete